jgi:hypothetical protein
MYCIDRRASFCYITITMKIELYKHIRNVSSRWICVDDVVQLYSPRLIDGDILNGCWILSQQQGYRRSSDLICIGDITEEDYFTLLL